MRIVRDARRCRSRRLLDARSVGVMATPASNAAVDAATSRCATEQHQVVAVDQLGLVDVAQDRLDLRRRLAQDARRFLRAVVDEAARDLASVGRRSSRRSRRARSRRRRRRRRSAAGSCRRARARAPRRRRASAGRRAARDRRAIACARASDVRPARERVPIASPAASRVSTSRSRPQAMTVDAPERAARFAASTLVSMPPRPSALPAPPAIASSAGSPARARAHERRRRIAPRIGRVEALLVGEQHQHVGFDQVGDQRAERVVVAEADLVGGDGVVLVDDRDHAEARAA